MFNILMVFLKEFFEKVDFEKINRQQKSMKNFPGGKELNLHMLDNFAYFFDVCRIYL